MLCQLAVMVISFWGLNSHGKVLHLFTRWFSPLRKNTYEKNQRFLLLYSTKPINCFTQEDLYLLPLGNIIILKGSVILSDIGYNSIQETETLKRIVAGSLPKFVSLCIISLLILWTKNWISSWSYVARTASWNLSWVLFITIYFNRSLLEVNWVL